MLQRALAQIDGLLSPTPRDGPYFEPFKRLGSAILEARRTALQDAGEAAIQAQVLPTMQRLRAFIVERYGPAAPEAGGLRERPGGAALYTELGACRAWGTSAAVWPQRSIFRRLFAP